MQEPFDIAIDGVEYSVFPEEDDTFTIFKNGKEYLRVQKDTGDYWLELDYETDLPLFRENEEVNKIGHEITKSTQ